MIMISVNPVIMLCGSQFKVVASQFVKSYKPERPSEHISSRIFLEQRNRIKELGTIYCHCEKNI